MDKLRIILADDERPAREFLKSILREFENVEIVGEADNGADAVEVIKLKKPDLAILDLNMPEVSGIDAVKMLRRSHMPLIAFVTAHDEFAIQAFELNAVDYLLKPVERSRLAATITRAAARLEHADWRSNEADRVKNALNHYDEQERTRPLERIPVRVRDEIYLIGVDEISAIVADGELLHITTAENKKYTINHRLKDLELRLDPRDFVRLSRGAMVNLKFVSRISPMPGGTYLISLTNGQSIAASRVQSKVLRTKLLKI